MATTGPFDGKELLVYSDGVAIASAKSHTLNFNSATIDVTTKDSNGWKDILPGNKDWSIDCEALVAFDDTEGAEELFTDFSAGTKVVLKFSTEETGDSRWTGSAYIETGSISAPEGDAVSYSCTFVGDGALTMETIT
jgi:predicted secreted protein